MIPVTVCAIINACLFLGTAFNNSNYLRDYRLSRNPDAIHYVREGRNTFLNGHFSRCEREPFIADAFRTPVYPLFAGALDILGGAAAIYLVQCLLHVVSCVLVFKIASRMFGDIAGLLASILLATDLMLAVLNFEPMSEVLYTCLNLAAMVLLLPVESSFGNGRLSVFVFAGLLLAAATLARPSGLYLPFLIAVAILIRAIATRRVWAGIATSSALLAIYMLPICLWIVRNYAVFGVAHLTTNDVIVMVYYGGAGAYEVENGIGLQEAQARIANDFSLPPAVQAHNPWTSNISVAEMDQRLRAAANDVLCKYPVSLITSSILGIVKAHVSHNVATLANMWGLTWYASTDELGSGDGRLSRLLNNRPLLIGAMTWQLLHTATTWLIFAVGLYVAIHLQEVRWSLVLLLGLLAYYQLTVALDGKEAYCRFRASHMPYVYVIAGAAAKRFENKRK